MLNRDYKEMLQCFCAEGVEYLIVGAYALAAHGFPRGTADLDIWVNPTPENAEKVYRSLARFGAPPYRHLAIGFCAIGDRFPNWRRPMPNRNHHEDFR